MEGRFLKWVTTFDSEPLQIKKKEDFKLQNYFNSVLKRYLEVSNKASNMANRAELGKYPTIIDIDKKMSHLRNYGIYKIKMTIRQ